MKIDRPLWAAGALLSPQQFQQQARWEAWTNESLAHLSLVHPWGVLGVAFDMQALRLGKLKATQVRVRMPDGTLVDTDHVDRLPPALEFQVCYPTKLKTLSCYWHCRWSKPMATTVCSMARRPTGQLAIARIGGKCRMFTQTRCNRSVCWKTP